MLSPPRLPASWGGLNADAFEYQTRTAADSLLKIEAF